MQMPRVKRVHAPRRHTDTAIRIGGSAYGVAAEIADPTGVIWALITAMDGTRDRDQIAAAVRAVHPELTRDAVLDAIDQLVGTGYFEDAATEPGESRYSRSAAYYSYIDRTVRESIGDVQGLIAAAHVTVLGVGGLGSAAAYSLAASGVGGLTLVDPDVVELSNLNRQVLYTTRDIGRPKVEAAAERLAELRPDLHLEIRQASVSTEMAVQELFAESRLIVQCADTPVEIEQWCNRSALRTGTAWVNGAYDGPHVCVTLYQPGTGPCWRCMRLDHYDRDPVPSDLVGSVHMATAATTNIAGNLTAHVALAAVTNIAPPPPGVPVVWNTVRLGHAFTVSVRTRPDCPDCSVEVLERIPEAVSNRG